MAIRYKFQEQKTTEASGVLLHLAGGKMPYLKLLKLLYISDRIALQEWERPITYDTYVCMNYGPVLSTTFDLIKGNIPQSQFWNAAIIRHGRYDLRVKDGLPIKKLSKAEVDLLNRVYALYGKMDKFQLAEFTHAFPEYKDPQGHSIPIMVEDILSGMGYSPSEVERVRSEIIEESEIAAVFGGEFVSG